MPGLTNQELTILIRALSFYGQDLAKNGAGASVTRSSSHRGCQTYLEMETVLRLICEFSHSTKGNEDADDDIPDYPVGIEVPGVEGTARIADPRYREDRSY